MSVHSERYRVFACSERRSVNKKRTDRCRRTFFIAYERIEIFVRIYDRNFSAYVDDAALNDELLIAHIFGFGCDSAFAAFSHIRSGRNRADKRSDLSVVAAADRYVAFYISAESVKGRALEKGVFPFGRHFDRTHSRNRFFRTRPSVVSGCDDCRRSSVRTFDFYFSVYGRIENALHGVYRRKRAVLIFFRSIVDVHISEPGFRSGLCHFTAENAALRIEICQRDGRIRRCTFVIAFYDHVIDVDRTARCDIVKASRCIVPVSRASVDGTVGIVDAFDSVRDDFDGAQFDIRLVDPIHTVRIFSAVEFVDRENRVAVNFIQSADVQSAASRQRRTCASEISYRADFSNARTCAAYYLKIAVYADGPRIGTRISVGSDRPPVCEPENRRVVCLCTVRTEYERAALIDVDRVFERIVQNAYRRRAVHFLRHFGIVCTRAADDKVERIEIIQCFAAPDLQFCSRFDFNKFSCRNEKRFFSVRYDFTRDAYFDIRTAFDDDAVKRQTRIGRFPFADIFV